MVSGYVLILAMLILGGIIATVGDRIGTKVGKARLSLFNLRPRQTATLVSIATGSVISASTLAILFGISSQLRMGVFELGRIQADLASAEDQLAQAQAEQDGVREDLEAASTERQRALARLREINQSLDEAVEQQEQTEAQLQRTRDQLMAVSEQADTLRQSTDTLRNERDRLLQQQATIREQIADRDRAIADLDQTIEALDQSIAERDQSIAEREQRLASLQAEQSFLEQQVDTLEDRYDVLFSGNIALTRNQELVFGTVRVDNREQAELDINQLLVAANQRASQAIALGLPLDQQVISVGSRELELLYDRIIGNGEHVVRVLSAANYISGEPCVVRERQDCIGVLIEASPNELLYDRGTPLFNVALDGLPRSEQELLERMNVLLSATQFIASQQGIVDDDFVIADNRTETLLAFFDAVQQETQALDIHTVAAGDIYTAGPLWLHLAAVRNGQILFSTADFSLPDTNRDPTPEPP